MIAIYRLADEAERNSARDRLQEVPHPRTNNPSTESAAENQFHFILPQTLNRRQNVCLVATENVHTGAMTYRVDPKEPGFEGTDHAHGHGTFAPCSKRQFDLHVDMGNAVPNGPWLTFELRRSIHYCGCWHGYRRTVVFVEMVVPDEGSRFFVEIDTKEFHRGAGEVSIDEVIAELLTAMLDEPGEPLASNYETFFLQSCSAPVAELAEAAVQS